MSHGRVGIRELAGWGFDRYEYRPETQVIAAEASRIVAERARFEAADALLAAETEKCREHFEACAERPDLLAEMTGLSWSLGVVDLRTLIAFQRRLAFSPAAAPSCVPRAGDWPALFEFCFAPPKPVEYTLTQGRHSLVLESANPDLHLRVTGDRVAPLAVHAGGPFFEVACYRDRWFLRDGYHRAYALMSAGVFQVPAAIVRARTIEELGANHPSFFPEDVLFSQAPPRVADFLNEELVLAYERAAFLKTIRIAIEETLQPAIPPGERP